MSDKNEIFIPAEYAPVLEGNYREAAIYGGRYSLKSHTVATILLVIASNKRARVLATREFQNSLADSSHQLFVDLIDKYKLPDFKITNDSIINLRTGSDFLFKGLRNNVQSIKSIEGIDIAWVEEAQTISEASLEVLTPTVRKPGSKIIYTYNRLRPDDPIHKRLVIDGRPNTLILNVNYDIAEKYGWMSEVIRLEMEDDKSKRPEIYKHKWMGEPVTYKGLIYPDFEKIKEVPKDAQYLGSGLDFGYTNHPSAIVDVYKIDNKYILDEILYRKEMSNKALAEILKLRGSPLVIADSAEPKSIAEIREYGVAILPAVKGKDSINSGIQLLQRLEIAYTDRSHNIEEEVLNYSWKVDRQDKSLNVPIDGYNHILDAARYFISHKEQVKPIVYGKPR